jgi:hypothetical protein
MIKNNFCFLCFQTNWKHLTISNKKKFNSNQNINQKENILNQESHSRAFAVVRRRSHMI